MVDLPRVVVVVSLLSLAACSDNAGPAISGGRCTDEGTRREDQAEQPDGVWSSWDTQEYRSGRLRCDYHAGAMPETTLGAYNSEPATTFPADLRHVIVILRENRSFDHYLGEYREQHRTLDKKATNPDPDDPDHPVARFKTGQYCSQEVSPDHEWTGAHLQYDNGKLDGFVAATTRDHRSGRGCIAMGHFDRDDLPLYYWLADKFAISESYFSSLLGPTMANISYYYNATSCGTTENLETTAEDIARNIVPWFNGCSKGHSIFDVLASHNLVGQVYNDSTGMADSAAFGLTGYHYTDLRSIDDLMTDIDHEQAGDSRLADVVFIEPNYGHLDLTKGKQNENDEHPPSNVQNGQMFVLKILVKLMSSPAVFNHSVIFITWDENGGFYDHVRPPPACAPDDYQPADFDFKRYGFRVPFFAISRWSRENYASHYTADHTSILRFIEAWKNLPALTARDANAWPLLDMFDFSAPHDIDLKGLGDARTKVQALLDKGCPGPEVP